MDSQKGSLCEVTMGLEPEIDIKEYPEPKQQTQQGYLKEEMDGIKRTLRKLNAQYNLEKSEEYQEMYHHLQQTIDGIRQLTSSLFTKIKKEDIQETVVKSILNKTTLSFFVDDDFNVRSFTNNNQYSYPRKIGLPEFVNIICALITSSIFRNSNPVFFDMFVKELHDNIFEILKKYIPESHPIFLEREHVNYADTIYKSPPDMGGTCSESSG